jgi:hypothetical protein
MLSNLHWRLLPATSILIALSSPAWAEDAKMQIAPATGPAVSAPNGKIALFAGSLTEGDTYGLSGAFTLPLGHSFGVQFDGMIGQIDDDRFHGIAAHLFWRDPAHGLFGFYASHVAWDRDRTFSADVDELDGGLFDIDGAEVSKAGFELEVYLQRVSVEGLLAYQFGTEEGYAGKASLAYYPLDDLRLDISVSHLEGLGIVRSAGAEWALPGGRGLSLFADASVTQDDDWRTLGGMKFHFGAPNKSLIRLHREDDPSIELPEDLYLTIGDSYCPVGTEELSGFCDGVL